MLKTSDQIINRNLQTLAPYAIRQESNQNRLHSEPADPYRTPFQRDRDRIIHSRAFRRLKDKTQVFVTGLNDHFRSRLTHTLEVAQVSRDIVRTLGLNEDLAETIALAHDLGHTPFGHSGETALNEILQKHGLHFEHNDQSKRTVEFLENPYPDFVGLNLTRETLDGLMKHQSPYDNATKTWNFLPSLEAQVVNFADEIAYTAHDTDDGLRSGIVHFEDLAQIPLWVEAFEAAGQPDPENRDRVVSKLLGLMIADITTHSHQSLLDQEIDSLEKVRTAKTKPISFSPEMREKIVPLRRFLYRNLYFSPQVHNSMIAGQKKILAVFEYFQANPSKIPAKFLKTAEQNEIIAIKDYIAGMTDPFLIKIWEGIQK